MRPLEGAAVAAGAVYLVALGWAMQHLAYDIWGAFIVMPVLAVLSAPLITRAFSRELAALRTWAWAGLAVKFAGAIIGYNIRFDAYGGAADAGRYHNVGKVLAEDVRSGLTSPFALVPGATGTEFLQTFTGAVYTIFGSSRLGGFLVFSWLSFWGLVFFIRAAHHAIDGLATRRYTLFVFLFPSLIYWGSSIGKEAVVGFFLGLAAWGAALVLARRGGVLLGVALTVIGLAGSGFVRPHFAAIWAGAIVIALVARVALDATGRREPGTKRGAPIGSVLLVIIAGIGFAVIATATLNFLPSDGGDDNSDVGGQLSSIFETAEERTTQGGSSFTPATISGPQDWPWAAVRTVTRPFITEANNLASLLPAAEMFALLVVVMFSWRRFANIPRLVLTTPYVVFAAVCVLTFGVAFSGIGNLGILVRQRSLILPLLLLFWCLPPIVFASERRTNTDSADTDTDASANRTNTATSSRRSIRSADSGAEVPRR